MKLFLEQYEQELSHIVENVEGKPKQLYIEGIFMGSEHRNRNGRIYKRTITEREVNKYQNLIKGRESLGCLNHPETTEIDPITSCILIEKLEMQGNDAYGKAKVLHTPNGKILETLINDDVRMGVSSRGVGDLEDDNIVAENYHLITVDVVLQPSNQDSYVNAVNECYKWVLNENTGLYVEKKIDEKEKTKTIKPVDGAKDIPVAKLEPDTIKVVEDATKLFHKAIDNNGSKEIKNAFIAFLKTLQKPKSSKQWLA